MPGAAGAVASLRAAGHRILFATNNATQRRDEFVAKLARVGVPAAVDDLATSASATARYLATLAKPPASALVIGAAALASDLQDAGIHIVNVESADTEQPDCVVASLDRDFTYRKLAQQYEELSQASYKKLQRIADAAAPAGGRDAAAARLASAAATNCFPIQSAARTGQSKRSAGRRAA